VALVLVPERHDGPLAELLLDGTDHGLDGAQLVRNVDVHDVSPCFFVRAAPGRRAYLSVRAPPSAGPPASGEAVSHWAALAALGAATGSRSKRRACTASATCGARTPVLPSRAAIVLA